MERQPDLGFNLPVWKGGASGPCPRGPIPGASQPNCPFSLVVLPRRMYNYALPQSSLSAEAGCSFTPTASTSTQKQSQAGSTASLVSSLGCGAFLLAGWDASGLPSLIPSQGHITQTNGSLVAAKPTTISTEQPQFFVQV